MHCTRTIVHLGLALICFSAPPAAAQDPALGEAVYEEHCSGCHGEKISNPSNIFDLKQLKADERPRFDRALRDGKGQMPSWEGVLSPEDAENVWAYIQLLGR